MTGNAHVKVRLQLDPDDWHGLQTEGIWVLLLERIGDKAIAEIDNIPTFTRSLSYRDRIVVAFNEGEVVLQAILEHKGHSTYRVLIHDLDDKKMARISELKALGCSWERGSMAGGILFAVDIPPDVDINEVLQLLTNGLKDGIWDVDEGYVGHQPSNGPVPMVSKSVAH